MEVFDLRPRGYCHGVVRALQIVKKAIQDEATPKPIYVLGLIVHNKQIKAAFDHYGIISLDTPNQSRLELLDQIKSGTVIFTAHGVSGAVYQKAKTLNIHAIDATCSDVKKVHDKVKEHLNNGFEVIYIGHANHPEPEGVLGIDSTIQFIKDKTDAFNYQKQSDKPLFVTNQTTLSRYDIDPIVDVLRLKYPDLTFDSDICAATTMRQNAVMNQRSVDIAIVVGDTLSSNTNKLAFVSKEIKQIDTYRIETLDDLDLEWFKNKKSVSVTSGASTPNSITAEVISFLKQFDYDKKETWNHVSQLTYLDILN